jgi:hypothetical protein
VRRLIRTFQRLAIIVVCFQLLSCERCGNADSIAELIEMQGHVERDWANRVNAWRRADLGARFRVGDGVRSKENSSAIVELSEGSCVRVKSQTMIRFSRSTSGASPSDVDVQMGEAEVVAGNRPVTVITRTGIATVKSGSRLQIRKTSQGVDYLVKIGTAIFQDQQGKSIEVRAGEGVRIGIGEAIFERFGAKTPSVPRAHQTAPEKSSAANVGAVPDEGYLAADIHGSGVRMRLSEEAPWIEVPAGPNRLAPRTALSLPISTTVQMRREKETATLYGEGEFIVGVPNKPLVTALMGKVSFETSEKDLVISVPGGVIIARGGEPGGTHGSVDVRADARTLVRAETGLIEINQPKNTNRLRAGEQWTIDGRDSFDRIDNGPQFADFSVPAGESFAVHVARPPVVVEFRFDEVCPEGAVVRRMGEASERSRGEKSANLLFPIGVSRYQVHCRDSGGIQNKPKVRGAIYVIRDSGTAQLPRSAPSSLVDADGRYYKILYQNLLPAITIRWPRPPKNAKSYRLEVVSQAGKKRNLTTDKPEYTFGAGSLGEGVHTIQFKTRDASASKLTRVEIRFDNAAPKASLREPNEGQFKPGDEVIISGVAVTGWKISLQGGTVSADANSRFSGKVVYTDKYRALALRLAHSKNGIHYYLRRPVSGIH